MIVWFVILFWSLCAGVVCLGIVFGSARNEGKSIPVARYEAWAAGGTGALITSAILIVLALLAGLVP
jgi:hypothetical protein